MRVLLVFNPTAGRRTGSADDLMRLIRDAGHQVECVSKKEESLADRLHEPFELIAVAGGDGTVAKVALKVPDPGPPVAILPFGTANNIATSLGLRGAPDELISRWPFSKRLSFDVWEAEGPWGQRHFIEGCGLGALTETALEMTTRKTSQLSSDEKLAEARRIFHEKRTSAATVTLRAELHGEIVEGDFSLFEILNLPTVGPNLALAPLADPGDGRLDVVTDKWPAGAVADGSGTRQYQNLRMWVRKGRIRLDDEFWPEAGIGESAEPFTVTIRPARRSLTVLAP